MLERAFVFLLVLITAWVAQIAVSRKIKSLGREPFGFDSFEWGHLTFALIMGVYALVLYILNKYGLYGK